MPKVFVEMDPEIARKLVEGYDNELEAASKADAAYYRQQRCPRCGGECTKHFISTVYAFSGGDLLPRFAMKCTLCDCVFDPRTGIITTLGNIGKITERVAPAMMPLGGHDDD